MTTSLFPSYEDLCEVLEPLPERIEIVKRALNFTGTSDRSPASLAREHVAPGMNVMFVGACVHTSPVKYKLSDAYGYYSVMVTAVGRQQSDVEVAFAGSIRFFTHEYVEHVEMLMKYLDEHSREDLPNNDI